jgi:hypothetical protein
MVRGEKKEQRYDSVGLASEGARKGTADLS